MQIDFNSVTPVSILVSNKLRKELNILKDKRFNNISNSEFFEKILRLGIEQLKKTKGLQQNGISATSNS